MLHLSTISTSALELLKQIQSIAEFSELRLVGGTALALQIGHRKSIDLDFFGKVEFEELNTNELFKNFKSAEINLKSKNINIYVINEIKVDFVNYPYPWLHEALVIDGIRMAHKEDIAAMKIAAITGRGSKKDFFDLFFLLKEYSLSEIIDLYKAKYFDASPYLAIKSLSYFDDAEIDPNPDMIQKANWEEVKLFLKKKIKEYDT